jgi:hypothetical protein
MNNNIYYCHINDDVEKFNKQFQHSILPCSTTLSVNEIPKSTKYDDEQYSRGNGNITPLKDSINVNTKPLNYCNNINKETILQCSVVKNNNCNYNAYIPSTQSDLYTLNVPYQKQHNKHDLLFTIPNFSSSCTPPVVNNLNAFNNFTREMRNQIDK